MYIVGDKAIGRLLGGDFYLILDMVAKGKPMTIQDMYCLQFKYDSYEGFRKFYNKKLKYILEGIKTVDDKSVLGKLLKMFFRK